MPRPTTPTRLRRGFSLLEMMVVIAIIALLAGLIVPAVSKGSTRDRERAQMTELARLLSVERVEAIRTVKPRAVRLRFSESSGFTVSTGAEPRQWGVGLLAPADPESGSIEGADGPAWEIRFAPSGRTHTLFLDFVATRASDRIWRLEFDPVSGAPAVQLGREAES